MDKRELKQMCAKRPRAEGGYLTVKESYHYDRAAHHKLEKHRTREPGSHRTREQLEN